MRSRIFSFESLRATSRGKLWIPAFLSLGFLLAFPIAAMIKLENWAELKYTADQLSLLYENMWKDGLAETGFAVTLAAAFFNGLEGFWYLYSSRKVDFYHSLPVKRSGMFLQRTYTGFVYFLVPYVVMEFLAVCIGAAHGHFSLYIMGRAAVLLLIHLAVYFLIYFSVVLVVCVTGNVLMGSLALLGFMLYAPVLKLLLFFCAQMFFKCFPEISRSYWTAYLTPAGAGGRLISLYSRGDMPGIQAFLLLAAAAAVMGLLAYLAYDRRPSEAAGTSVVFRWLGVVMKFLVTVPSALAAWMIFYSLPAENGKTIWGFFGLILGAVVVHGVIEVILQMDFRAFFSRKLHLLLAAAAALLCAVVFQKDLFGYDSYLPAYDKLAGINFEMNIGGEYIPCGEMTEKGEYRALSWDSPERMLRKSETEAGEQIYRAIEDIVADKSISADAEHAYTDIYPLNVKYTLKSGREVYRRYIVSPGQINRFYSAAYGEANMKELKYGFLDDVGTEYLRDVSFAFQGDAYYTVFQDDREKEKALVEAYRRDVEDAAAKELLESPVSNLYLYYEDIPQPVSVHALIPGKEATADLNVHIYIYPSFDRTLAILRETGYPLSMEGMEAESAEINYYNGPADHHEFMTVTDKGKIAQIMENLIPDFVTCPWKEYSRGITVVVTMKDGDIYNGLFLAGEEPDFVKTFVEKADEKAESGEIVYSEGSELESVYPEEAMAADK